MKRLLSLVVGMLHVLVAVAAFAAPQAPVPPKPAPPKPASVPTAPAPPAAPTAADIGNENGNTTVEKGQTVKDAIATNGDVTVLGHVTGNATATNGNVYVRSGGRVDGNAMAENGNVVKDPGGVIVGEIASTNGGEHDTTVDLSHDRREGVQGVGNDVIIPRGQTVNEATAVQGDVIVYGHVTGDATAVLGNVYVRSGGKVDGDASAVAGKVIRTGDGNIGGDVTSLDLGIPRNAWWSLPGGAWWTCSQRYGGWAMYVAYLGLLLVLAALVTAVVIALFPGRMATIAECSLGMPGWSLLYGVVGAMLLIPVAVLLTITCIGIPLIAVEAVLAVLVVIAGGVGVRLALGQKMGIGVGHPVASAVLAGVIGSCLMTLLHLVPFIGGLIVWILYALGSGAVLMTGFGARPDWFPSRFDKRRAPAAPTASPGE